MIIIQLVDYNSFILSIFYLPNGKEVCLHLEKYNERKEGKRRKVILIYSNKKNTKRNGRNIKNNFPVTLSIDL